VQITATSVGAMAHEEESVDKRGREEVEEGERERTRSKTGSPERSLSRGSSRRRRSRSGRRSRSRTRSRSRGGERRSSRRSRSRTPESSEGYRLHVADISEECRKKDLERIFMKYGPLKEIWLASYAPFYAFIVYRHRTDAEDAASGADGETIAGRRIRVSPARPRTVGPRDRFIPDKYSRDRDDYYRGRDYDRRDYDRRDSDRRDYREDRYYSRSSNG